MSTMSLTVKYDTYDNWKTNNPVLGSGEAAVDTTNNKVKLGDGTTKWNDLQYITNSMTDAIIKNTKGVTLSSGQSLVTSKLYYNPATNLLTVGNDGNGTISASKLLGTANESLFTSGVKQLSGAQVGTRLGEMYYDTHDNCLCICTDAANNKWTKLYDTSKYAPAINTDSLSTNSLSTESLSVSGNTSVPTKSSGDSSTSIANTKFVSDAINSKADKVLSSSKEYTDNLSSVTQLKKYILDLSKLDVNTFYPVVFDSRIQSIEAEIHSRNVLSNYDYNQNVLSFKGFASGWDDGLHRLTIKDYYVYDTAEITIGCVAFGAKQGGVVVWLRGGEASPYIIISTIPPQLFANGWNDNNGSNAQIATIGSTYHGAETGNANMNIMFSPLDIPSNSAKNLNYTTYGTFETAIKDSAGNVITDTYLKKTGDTVTGTLNVPTQVITDNSTKVANTAFVQSAVSQLVNSAPETLDTLNELSNALGDDPNFATTVTTMIGQKLDKAGGTITEPILYDKTPNDDTELPNKAYVDSAIKSAVEAAVTSVTKTLSDNMHAQYPVGCYIYSDKSDNPATYLPYMSDTTWVQTAAGRVLIGAGKADSGTVYNAGGTGGEEKHTLTTSEMPAHAHSMSSAGEHNHEFAGPQSSSDNKTAKYEETNDYNRTRAWLTTNYTRKSGSHIHTINPAGDGSSHNVMQPYLVVYIFKRTA